MVVARNRRSPRRHVQETVTNVRCRGGRVVVLRVVGTQRSVLVEQIVRGSQIPTITTMYFRTEEDSASKLDEYMFL